MPRQARLVIPGYPHHIILRGNKRSVSDEELSLIRNATHKGGIFGNKEFFEKIAKLAGRSVVLRPRGRPKKSL